MGAKNSQASEEPSVNEELLGNAVGDEENQAQGKNGWFGKKKKYQPARKEETKEIDEVSPAKATEDIKERASFGRLMSLIKPEWKTLVLATIALICSTAAQLSQPLFFGKIITVCSSNSDNRMKDLNQYSFLLLCILAFGGVFTILRGWLYTLVGERLVRNLRKSLFEKIITQDISFFDANKTGELMNRLSSDTAVIQSCLSVNISMGLRSVAEVFVSIALLFITSWQLTLVMMAVVPILMIIVILYGRFTRKLTKDYQDALAYAADSGSESIGNHRIMKSFAAELWEIAIYTANIQQSYRKGAQKALAYGIFAGGIGFLAGVAILVVVYYGATLVIQEQLAIGELTAFILYTIYIAVGLGIFSGLYTEFSNALGASERIFRILDTEPAIPHQGGLWPTSPAPAPTAPSSAGSSSGNNTSSGQICLDHVTFAYPSRPDVLVLQDFTLHIQPKMTVALVGASGSGKSTVLCLLERFYDLASSTMGRITIDGYDLRALDPRYLHSIISIVPQEPVLFSGSIRSNITYSRAALRPEVYPTTGANKTTGTGCSGDYEQLLASDEEVISAAKMANAHQFISQFPEGYQTIVGERGVRLSGGQKQRVAIARALLANPKILLLDEATSALDAESEMLVQDAINKVMQDRTVIIIAHRLSTVRDADVIAVVEQGRIVDAGTHDELLKKSTVYANLVRKQLDWSSTKGGEVEDVVTTTMVNVSGSDSAAAVTDATSDT